MRKRIGPPKVNLCKLERFFFDEISRQLRKIPKVLDAHNLYASPLRLSIKEVFSEMLEKEKQGKRYQFRIASFIYKYAFDYLDIYERARREAYRDYLKVYIKPKIKIMDGVELISISEAAKLLGMTENGVRYKIKQGHLERYMNERHLLRVDKNEIVKKYLTFSKVK